METEIWKDIAGYEGLYQVSNLGQVKALSRRRMLGNKFCVSNERILRPRSCNGYIKTSLNKNGKGKDLFVHRLVAEAFIPNPYSKRTVNHINGDKADNRLENLEWATYSENNLHAYEKLGHKSPRGWTGCFGAEHHTSKPVKQLSSDGEYIAEYAGLSEAERATGVLNQSISKCCKGIYKTAGGYIWKYK